MQITPATRISIGLVLLTACVLLAGDLLGLTPGRAEAELRARKQLCETLAVQFALAAQKNDLRSIETSLEVVVERNDEVLSAALRDQNGRLLASAGDHLQLWGDFADAKSTPTHTRVPIFRGDQRWGTVEVRFPPLRPPGLAGALANPLLRLLLFVAAFGFFSYRFFMKRMLRHLDPSQVVPARVKAALDILSEGVVLLDEKERIVLANSTFCERMGEKESDLLGRRASELGWLDAETGEPAEDFPWQRAMAVGEAHTGTSLAWDPDGYSSRLFVVNGSPIQDGKGKARGVLVTFDDITELEAKHRELRQTLAELQRSQAEVEKQNDKLSFLAAHDPMTGLLNRRSFFERFERDFEEARTAGKDISLIMCDIDHFKSINDRHGHAVGDQVIQMVSEVLRSTLRETDAICRYGGEEFCVAMAGIPLVQAAEIVERLRATLANRQEIWGRVTGSFGVSSIDLDADTPAELIDQADQALYAAKQSGRNRVARWDVVIGHGQEADLPEPLSDKAPDSLGGI